MKIELTLDETILIKSLLTLQLEEKKRRILRVRKSIAEEYFDDDIRNTLNSLLDGLIFDKNNYENLIEKFDRKEVKEDEM